MRTWRRSGGGGGGIRRTRRRRRRTTTTTTTTTHHNIMDGSHPLRNSRVECEGEGNEEGHNIDTTTLRTVVEEDTVKEVSKAYPTTYYTFLLQVGAAKLQKRGGGK